MLHALMKAPSLLLMAYATCSAYSTALNVAYTALCKVATIAYTRLLVDLQRTHIKVVLKSVLQIANVVMFM
jgi:hypothetical protein